MTEQNTKFQTCIDVAAAIFVSIFLISPWWMYVDVLRFTTAAGFPILPLMVFGASAPFFLFGICWLLYRYTAKMQQKFPAFFGTQMHIWLILIVLLTPLFLLKHMEK